MLFDISEDILIFGEYVNHIESFNSVLIQEDNLVISEFVSIFSLSSFTEVSIILTSDSLIQFLAISCNIFHKGLFLL
jgi:hypothetical protein